MKWLWGFLFLILAQTSFAYQELTSYEKMELPKDGKKTWLIFDIDNTLLRPHGEIGSHQWADYMAERYLKEGHSEREAGVYQTQVFTRGQKFVDPVIVDSNIYKLLEKLEILKIPFFALTARSALVLKETTIQQMRQVELLPSFDRNHPFWSRPAEISAFTQQGVVFANGVSKGEILKKLIHAAKDRPERIIFVDDRDYNVTSIEKAGIELGLEVIGYRFSATDQLVLQFDSKKADREWLAAKYLNSPLDASTLNNSSTLGRSLMKTELGRYLVPNSETCNSVILNNMAKVSCAGELSRNYGNSTKVERDYILNFDPENGFYTGLDWDLF